MPEHRAARDQTREGQKDDQTGRDADGERNDIAGHRQRDHRQHQADHDPLPHGQPGRPARRQAQAEDQAARNQR
jgi:hypothetical protein